MNLFEIFTLAAMTVIAVQSKPTNWLFLKLTRLLSMKKSIAILDFLRCPLCLGFWVGLFGTFSILDASAVSVIAAFIHNQISSGRL